MKNRFLVKAFALLSVLFSSTFALAQQPAQFTERPEMSVSGQYDIKMVSSTVMQSVWLSQANPYVVHSAMSNEEMRLRGASLEHNNNIAGPNSVRGVTMPMPAGVVGSNAVFADCDDDMSTFQSSAAFVDFGSEMDCTTVEAAYLYWNTTSGAGANYAAYPGLPTMRSFPGGNNVGAVSGNNYQTVLFKAPGDANYTSVTSTRNWTNNGALNCFADVTDLVKGKGGGMYWVANIYCGIKSQTTAGWSLIVLFRPPNCPPRTIKFWDTGTQEVSNNSSIYFTLSFGTNEVPASGNSRSYLGIAALDGENFASYLLSNPGRQVDYLEFNSRSATQQGQTFKINPFADGQTAPFPGEPQPGYSAYNTGGNLLSTNGQDGFSSSRISTWDPEKGTNGNEVIRIPDNVNTLGFDAHHLRLPMGAMVPSAETATMTYYAGAQGGTKPIFAYMAIETLQPDLKLSMRTQNASTAPDGVLTYVLRIENIGPIASKPTGTYVLDTLDRAVDFIPGSVQYVRGNEPTPHEANNVGADVNEYLKFYIPSIAAAGANGVAQDSVVIKFNVSVKGLDRSDIWAYGCNRDIRNRATMVFLADDDSELIVGSNATAGCGGAGTYHTTPVMDTALQEQYVRTHNIEASMTEAVNQGNVNIINTLRNFLIDQYNILGLNVAEVAEYSFFTEIGVPVNPAANFERSEEAYQNYYAEADLDNGCTETFYFKILVAKVPKFDEALEAPGINAITSCAGAADAELRIVVSEGEPSYSCRIYDETNGLVYTAFSPASQETYTFEVKGLAKGSYRVEIGDRGSIPATGTLVVADPQAIVPAVTTQCTVAGVVLSASAAGFPNADYAWKESTDGVSWSSVLGVGQDYTTTGGNKLYQVTVCNGTCSVTREVALPTVSVTPAVATVSILAQNPSTTYNAVLTGVNLATTYNYAWALSTGTIPGTLAGANTAALTVSNITDRAMSGNKYKVTVTDAQLGCVGSAEGTLIAVEAPVVKLQNWSQASCPDASDGTMTIAISNGEELTNYNIELQNAQNTVIHSLTYTAPALQEVTVNNLPAGNYTWVVIDPVVGPIPYGVFTITAIARPVTALSVESVCFGAELVAFASGDHPSYQWTVNGAVDTEQTGSTYVYNYDTNTTAQGTLITFNVAALSDLGCSSTVQSATVELKPVPDAFVPNVYTSCIVPGGTVAWESLINNTAGYQLYWYDSPVGGETWYFPNPVSMSIAGEYSKYVVAVGDGCPSLRTEVKIIIHPSPRIDQVQQVDLKLRKINVSGGLAPYIYDFEGASGKTEGKFEITGLLPIGVHNLLVTDSNGCSSEGSFIVNKALLEPAPFFTPNGDQYASLWTIKNLELYLDANITIEIFDRTGKLLAHYNAVDFNGWDGRFNGQLLPSTDYWYLIHIQKTNEQITGNFTLKR